MKRITEVTKRDICDLINTGIFEPFSDTPKRMLWFGRLDDVKFLERLYNLKSMPSYDSRFTDAGGDIWQHTINNNDYDYDWIFYDERFDLMSGDDENYLRFLCEMFHPAVIKGNMKDAFDSIELKYMEAINVLLVEDGYELIPKEHLSGRPVFTWHDISDVNPVIKLQVESLEKKFNSDYMRAQIIQMNESVTKNPSDAIGKAKELVESCCKTILENKGVTIDKNWEVPRLMKETCSALKLTPDDIPDTAKASETIRGLLQKLAAIAHNMAELRNPYGTGHGKSANYKGLSPRHARLAVGAATTSVHFLWETYEEQEEKIGG